MTSDEFLAAIHDRYRALLDRGRAAGGADLNARGESHRWTIGQLFEHMAVSHEPYARLMAAALESPRLGDAPPRPTWVGTMLERAAGPAGNASVPRAFMPGAGPHGPEVVERWIASYEALDGLAARAAGVDLGRTRFRNPLVPLVRMNLVDGFAVTASHGARHLDQIEALLAERVP